MIPPRTTTKVLVENVSMIYAYHGRRVVALQNLTFSVGDKEFLCILGPSGCGKSSVLHLIAGFVQPTSGEVRLNEQPIRQPGADRGVVFQKHSLFPWKTVYENIELGLRMKGLPKNERRGIVYRYLEAVELTEFANSYPSELSVGMQQRVGLARAYANDPEILLMDEPFASLDAQTAIRMRELLLRLWTQNLKTVFFITHDIEEAIMLADRVLVLSARPGRVKAEFNVDLARPRTSGVFGDPRYVQLRKSIMECVLDISTGVPY